MDLGEAVDILYMCDVAYLSGSDPACIAKEMKRYIHGCATVPVQDVLNTAKQKIEEACQGKKEEEAVRHIYRYSIVEEKRIRHVVSAIRSKRLG